MERTIPIPIGYQEALESPKASRTTEAIWTYRAEVCGTSIVLPDGRCDLILRASGAEPDRFVPIVTGPATSAYTVRFEKGDVWYGARLRPERAIALWGGEVRLAEDKVLRGQAAHHIFPTLPSKSYANTPIERLKYAVLQLDFPKVSSDLSRALDVIHLSGGRVRVEKLCDYVSCSARHLNRLFRGNIGLGAKTYIQITQFHRALRLISSGGLSPIQAAFEGGYADQAHMTRAFRRFGGFAPASIPVDLDIPAVFLN